MANPRRPESQAWESFGFVAVVWDWDPWDCISNIIMLHKKRIAVKRMRYLCPISEGQTAEQAFAFSCSLQLQHSRRSHEVQLDRMEGVHQSTGLSSSCHRCHELRRLQALLELSLATLQKSERSAILFGGKITHWTRITVTDPGLEEVRFNCCNICKGLRLASFFCANAVCTLSLIHVF